MQLTSKQLQMSRASLVLLTCIAITSAALYILIAKSQFQNPFRVPVVQHTNILNIENNHSASKFRCPSASQYAIIIGYPNGKFETNPVNGRIVVYENHQNVLNYDLSKTKLSYCNWLDMYNMKCFIIENGIVATNAKTNALKSALTPGSEYGIMATNGPVGASIWLVYTRPSGWSWLSHLLK